MSNYTEFEGLKIKPKEKTSFETKDDYVSIGGLKVKKENYDNRSTYRKAVDQEHYKKVKEDEYYFGKYTNQALATVADVGLDIAEGGLGYLEGVVDWGTYRLADTADFLNDIGLGLGVDTESMRQNADFNSVGSLFGRNDVAQGNLIGQNWTQGIENTSWSPDFVDQVFSGVGQVGMAMATAAVTGGGSLTTAGITYTSAYGNARSEAKRNGATDREANRVGIIHGIAEGISEQVFSGIPGLKVEGWGDALSGKISDYVGKYFGKGVGKFALKALDSVGEGAEEIISNIIVAVGNDIAHGIDSNFTYGMENQTGNVFQDVWDQMWSKDSWQQFISAAFTSAIVNTGKSVIDLKTQNQIINAYAKENGMSFKDAKYILTGQIENAKQGIINDEVKYNSQAELEQMAKQRVLNYMKASQGKVINNENVESWISDEVNRIAQEQNLDETQKEQLRVNIRGQLEYQVNSPKGQSFNLTEEEKQGLSQNEQELAQSITDSGANNTEYMHGVYEFVKQLQQANESSKYRMTTYEDLVNKGILEKQTTEDGKTVYTRNGQVITPLGFKYGDTIYLNLDEISKDDTKFYKQTLGHEMGEAILSSDPTAYQQLKDMVIELYGKGDLETYRQIYGDLTQDVENEYVNDKLGELFESQKLIDEISNNKTLLQKIIAKLKELIQYVTSSKEQRQLREVEKKLEKKYIELYKVADFSIGNGEGAFQLKENQNGHKYDIEENWYEKYDGTKEEIPTNLVPYVVANPSVGDYLAYTQYEPFYELGKEQMDYVTTQISGRAAKEFTFGEKYGTITLDGKSYYYEIYNDNEFGVIKINNNSNGGVVDERIKEQNYRLPSTDTEIRQGQDSRDIELNRERAGSKSTNNMVEQPRTKGSELYEGIRENNGELESSFNLPTNENYRGSHQIQNGQSITNLDINEIENKVEEANGYLTKQDQKDLSKLKNILNNPNETVKVYRASPVNELNSGDWITTDKSYAQNVADNNGGKVYTYEVKASDLYYPDNVNDLPSLHRLSSFQYNGDNKTNQNIQFSLSKDSQGRELSKQQQEYFKDSKVRDEDGRLLEVYHGTSSDFTKFDRSYLGSSSGDLGFLGDGFYFATHEGEAKYYGGKSMAVYLNVTNPFNIQSLTNYNGMHLRGEDSNSYIEIKNLVDMNPEWGNIELQYGYTYNDIANAVDDVLNSIKIEYLGDTENGKQYKVTVGDNWNIVNAISNYSMDELTADAFTREMRKRFYYIPHQDVIQNIASEAQWRKINNDAPIKTFSEVLQEQGYDGVIQGDNAAYTDEIVVFNPNQIKNVDNTTPTTNPDIRFSLSVKEANTGTDNSGNKLSKGQQNYFKDSKATDDKGNLIKVYHTTTDEVAQFNEFDPTGTQYYRFGDQVVNYYTDSKDMSGSYASQEYNMADTSKLKNIEEAKKWLEDNRFNGKKNYDYKLSDIKSIKGAKRLVLYDYDNGYVIGNHDYFSDEELLKKIKRDVMVDNDSQNFKLQYQGYVNITNPYIIDAEARNWNQVVQQSNEFIDELEERVPEDIKNNLTRLYNESANMSGDARDTYNNLEQIIHGVWNSAVDEDIKKVNNVVMNVGFEEIEQMLNGVSPGVNAWYNVADYLEREGLIGSATKSFIINEFRLPEQVKTLIEEAYNKSFGIHQLQQTDVMKTMDQLGRTTTLKDIYHKNKENYDLFEKYRYPNSYFLEQISAEGNDYLGSDLEDMFETRAELYSPEQVGEEIAQAASVGFSKPELIRLWGTSKTTNDVVKEIIASNQDGTTNYDGVIITNVYDYGGRSSEGVKPHDLYVTFESNQFKAADNLNPTKDEDIRYQLTSEQQNQKGVGNKAINTLEDYMTELNLPSYQETSANLPNESVEQMVEDTNLPTEIKEEVKQSMEEKRRKLADKRIANMIEKQTYKSLNAATKTAKSYLDFNQKETQEFKDKLLKLAKMPKDTLIKAKNYNQVKDIIKQYADKDYTFINQDLKAAQKEVRNTPLVISDDLKAQITDWGDFRKSSGLDIHKGQNSNVDTVYEELSDMYPEYFDREVTNYADQLYDLSEFVKRDTHYTEHYELSDNTIDQITNSVWEKLSNNALTKQEINDLQEEINAKVEARTREVVREDLLNTMDLTVDDIEVGKDISNIAYQRTDPKRVMEKVFGYEVGTKMNNALVNFAAHQNAEQTRWSNQEKAEIADLGIKARSKESAAVQKYGEGQYVNDKGEVVEYNDHNLMAEFPNVETQEKIKNAARVLRQKYDNYIDKANPILEELGYDPIPKRKDYFRHFNELQDKFSQWGIPFNRESMNSENLPTDINGVTDQFKPGKNFFASALQRKGVKTTYDAITGIDQYIDGIGNLIFQTETIQRYRAVSKLVRDTYGQTHGLEDIESMTPEEAQQRVEDVYSNKLSGFAAWLDEQANAIAGKKGGIDRAAERFMGRKIYTGLNNVKKQVGSNMTGFNVRSAMTNFASAVQGASKTNKLAFGEGTAWAIKNIIKEDTDLINKSDFLTNRYGTKQLSKKLWQKLSEAGQVFMNATDSFTSKQIWGGKYFEGLHNGLTQEAAIKQADDFAARIMGDRSKGQTAEIFNSKTLGLLTQFQLEVNNQWSSMIHDNKMEFQKNGGLKTAASVTFQLGQLYAMSWMFNNLMKALTGSDVMFDPIDLLMKFFDPDDDKTVEEKATSLLGDVVNQLPMASIFTGGRIPISEAFTGVSTLGKKMIGQTDKYGNAITWENVKDDLIGSAAYYLFPTGYGQLKKTTQGLSMYNPNLPLAGSYTNSGRLRFEADTSTLGKVQAALFGRNASANAREYYDNGYKTLTPTQVQDAIDYGMDISTYREFKDDLNTAKQTKVETDNGIYEMYTDNDNNWYWYNTDTGKVYKTNTSVFNEDDLKETDLSPMKLTKVTKSEGAYDYIMNMNLPTAQKLKILNNELNKKETITDEYGFEKYKDKEGKAYWYDEKNNIVYDSKYNKTNKKVSSLTKASTMYTEKDMGDYNSLAELNYSVNNPDKYATIKQITTYDKYIDYKSEIDRIKNQYSDTASRKAAVFKYINSLNLSKYQKIMLQKMAGGYSIKDYESQMFEYINSLDLTKAQKQAIHKELFGG